MFQAVAGALADQLEMGVPVAWRAGWRRCGAGPIVVQLRARTAEADVLAEAVAAGGSGASLEPFTAEVRFDEAPTRVGFVLAADTADADVAIPAFAAGVVLLGP